MLITRDSKHKILTSEFVLFDSEYKLGIYIRNLFLSGSGFKDTERIEKTFNEDMFTLKLGYDRFIDVGLLRIFLL